MLDDWSFKCFSTLIGIDEKQLTLTKFMVIVTNETYYFLDMIYCLVSIAYNIFW